MALSMVVPNWAGDRVTWIPASSMAANFSLAPPFPPATMAPACPVIMVVGEEVWVNEWAIDLVLRVY